MWVLLFLLASAVAAPCEQSFDVEALRRLASEADAAIDQDDMVAHGRVMAEIRASAECLSEPVDAKTWARLLVTQALVESALGRDWRAPLTSALLADPGVAHDVGPKEIREYPLPIEDPTYLVPVARDGIFFLDGRQVEAVQPGELAGPHLVQAYAAGRWETRYLEDAPFPSNWVAPVAESAEVKRRRSPALPVTGLALGVAGAATAVTSWAMAVNAEAPSAAKVGTLKALNVGGWALAGVGSGLAVVHVARPAPTAQVTISGRF